LKNIQNVFRCKNYERFAATFMIDGEINTHKLQNHVVTLVVQSLNVYFPIAVFMTELNTINLDPFCRGLYL
jgi:hypothetical protein